MTVTWKEALTDKQLARKNELKQLRANQRKQQKQRLKRAMGCVYNDCAEKKVRNLHWRAKHECVKNFLKPYTQKQLLNLGDANFKKHFKEWGECVCKKHLRFESLLDYMEGGA